MVKCGVFGAIDGYIVRVFRLLFGHMKYTGVVVVGNWMISVTMFAPFMLILLI